MADTVDGGDGTDTLQLTTSADFTSTLLLSNIEKMELTSVAGLASVVLSGATSLTALSIEVGGDAGFAVSSLVTGVTVSIEETAALALAVDTAASASLTLAAAANTAATVTVTDATSVTVTSTALLADLTALVLDSTDTTTLTLTGGTTAAYVLSTGNVTGTDQLTTLSASSSTTTATVTMGDMVDADSLTSLTVAASTANVTLGSIGGTGTAEGLATVTVTAASGATATLNGTITADTTDSTATVNASGATPTWKLTGVSAAAALILAKEAQITAIQVTDTAANLSLNLDNLNNVASKLSSITLSDNRPLEITGTQLIKDALALAKISGTYTTNLPSYNAVNGTANNDNLLGTFGNDHIKGGAGNDQIAGFSGNDLVDGGDGSDTLVISTNASKYKLDLDVSGTLSLQNKTTGDTVNAINIEAIKFQDKTLITEREAHASYSDLPESLWQFFIVAFNAAPGVTYMNQLGEAYRYGLSVKQIVDIFTTKSQFTGTYPSTFSRQELAINLVNNIVKDGATEAVKQSAVSDIVLAMDYGLSVGDVIYNVFGNLAKFPYTDPSWGRTAQQFANQIAVAKVYTDTLSQSTGNLGILKSVLTPVTADTDVSSSSAMASLIGVALIDSAMSA